MTRAAATALAFTSLGLWIAAAPAQAAAARHLAVSPEPGTPDASPTTQVSFLGAPARSLGRITVSGSRTGRHSGKLYAYSTGQGGSFIPDKPFAPGERVEVRMAARGALAPVGYRFGVAQPAPLQLPAGFPPQPPGPSYHGPQVQSFRSRTDLHPPALAVLTQGSGTAPGDIFTGPFSIPVPGKPPVPSQKGALISDGRGQVVWFHPLPGTDTLADLKVQTFRGQPVLTWWQGQVYPTGFGYGKEILMDNSYRLLGQVSPGNGYQTDLHDFIVTPQQTAWLIAYTPVATDLRSVKGPARASTLDNIVQEVDLPTGLVMWEWHSLGHVPLSDTYAAPVPNVSYDPWHVNSIALSGPDVLLSMKNTWGVYLVNQSTGRIRWILGGRRSTFALTDPEVFAYQHDARMRGDGTISVFDDEAAPQVGPTSRGLVLRLDLTHRTATLAQQYIRPQATLAGSQGNVQTLPNGDLFVGWGNQPFVSEFAPGGQLLFDAEFPPPVESYRGFRFPWSAQPLDSPALAVTGSAGSLTAYASWNGATEVASWQVLAGPAPGSLSPAGSAPRTGFETAVPIGRPGPYFAVRALGSSGQVLGTSPTIQH